MRKELEAWLNRVWYGEAQPAIWLRALAPVYALASRLEQTWQRSRRPADLGGAVIIVVGNLTAGGSGKTPLAIRLCQLLQTAGLRPGVISRGHGRSGRGMVQVTNESRAAEVGDEPLLMARRTGVPIVVAANRCAAARRLFGQGIQAVISDDGLQHQRLPRLIEICVIDGTRGLGNGHLLPAGPLREPAERLASVDHVIVNSEADSPEFLPGEVRMHLAPGLLRALDGSQSWRLSQFSGCRVSAVAGIGNPERFFATLRQGGLKPEEHRFPDHHRFSPADFRALNPELPIIMTEKDAIKCFAMDLPNAWYLSVDAVLPLAWEADFVRRVSAAVTERGA